MLGPVTRLPDPRCSPARVCNADPNLSRDQRTAQRIACCVAKDFAVKPADLVSTGRGRHRLAYARQVAMYLCHVSFSLSMGCVGGIFGRGPSTVAHACRVIEDDREDRWLDQRIVALEVECRLALEVEHASAVKPKTSAR